MRVCVYCQTRYQKGSKVTFHKFPTDSTLELWLKHMNVVNWRPRKYDYLCSKHFTNDCFIKHESRTTLKKCSIPKIFSGSTNDRALPSATTQIAISIYDCQQDEKPIKLEKITDLKTELATSIDDRALPSATTQIAISIYDCQQDEKPIKLEKIPHLKTELATSIESTSSTYERMATPTPSISGTVKRRLLEPNTNNLCCRSIGNDPEHSGASKKARATSEIVDNIKHDHRYENCPRSSKKTLQRVQKSLKNSRARVKVLSQHVKRLNVSVSSLRNVIRELKKRDR